MSSYDDARVLAVLEAFYEALEVDGTAPDLDLLCRGDPELIAQVSTLLGRDPIARGVVESGREPVGEAAAPATSLGRERLGGYRILQHLGTGGMGEVYLAEQAGLDRPIALKVLRPAALADRRARLRLEREAIITGRLDHPNIVPVYDVGEEDGLPYIAMKWLRGPALDVLPERLPPDEVARIGVKVARALEEAHLSGVLHRDVKPANIIFDDGEPFIVDFGFAVSRQFAERLSQSGVASGTLAYMPPEQLSGDVHALDARADVYSLGATLYELLAGAPPFDHVSPEPLVRDIFLRDPAPLGLDTRQRDLESIVLRALEKRPARRYQTAAALADDLERYLRGDATVARPIGPVARTLRLARRHRVAAAAIVLAVITAVSFAGYVGWQSWQRGRELDLAVSDFDRFMSAEDFPRARARLEGLPDALRRDSRITGRRARLRARQAADRCLDLQIARPSSQSPQSVARVRAELDASTARQWQPRISRLALALLVIDAEPTASVRMAEEVEALDGRRSRGTEAILQLATGSFASPVTEGRDALDHVLTFVAMRRAGASQADQALEIERALDLDPRDFRSRLAAAVLSLDASRVEEARRALDLLSDPWHESTIVDGLKLQLDVALGRFDSARRRIEEIDEWTSWQETVRLHLAMKTQSAEQVDAEMARATARWPEAGDVLLLAADWSWRRGRADHAEDLLRQVAESAPWRHQRELARSSQLLIQLTDLAPEPLASDEVEDLEEDLLALTAQAAALSAAARDPLARARGHFVVGFVKLLFDDLAAGVSSLEAARLASPLEVSSRRRLAELVANSVEPNAKRRLEHATGRSLGELVHLGGDAVEEALAVEARGAVVFDSRTRLELYLMRARLAELVLDWARVRDSLQRVETLARALDEPAEDLAEMARRIGEHLEEVQESVVRPDQAPR